MSARFTSSLLSRTIAARPSSRLLQLRNQLAHPSPTRTMATAIPKTMKGVLIEKTGGVEVLDYRTDLPVPTPKEGEILVKNDFIGINFIDTCVCLPLTFSFLICAYNIFSNKLTNTPPQLLPQRPLPISQARDFRPRRRRHRDSHGLGQSPQSQGRRSRGLHGNRCLC